MPQHRWIARLGCIALLIGLIYGGVHTQAAAPTSWQSRVLSKNLSETSSLSSFVPTFYQLSPDGRQALYVANADNAGVYDLYSVDTDGLHAPVRLTSLPDQDTISMYSISPDGQSVVYRVKNSVSGATFLYSQLLSGGSATLLDQSSTVDEHFDFRISPDSQTVVYRKLFSSTELALMSTPISTSQPLTLSNDLHVDAFNSLALSPDSRYVFFVTYNDQNQPQIYRAPLDAASPELIAPAPQSGGSFDNFTFTSDSQTFIYQFNSGSQATLYTVPVTGTTPISLTTATIVRFELTPDDQHIVMLTTTDIKPDGLYSVPLSGGTPIQLNPNDGALLDSFFAIAPDSQHVAFDTGVVTPSAAIVYSNNISGTALTQLSAVITNSELLALEIDPTSQYVVFTNLFNNHWRQTFSARLDGTSTQPLSAPASDSTVIGLPVIDPSGAAVIYPSGTIVGSSAVFTQLNRAPLNGDAAEAIVPSLTNNQRIIEDTYTAALPNRYVYVQRSAAINQNQIYVVREAPATVYLPFIVR